LKRRKLDLEEEDSELDRKLSEQLKKITKKNQELAKTNEALELEIENKQSLLDISKPDQPSPHPA